MYELMQKLSEFNQTNKEKDLMTKQIGMSYGVAQGSPISPLVSILGLTKFLSSHPSVSYADDPIFYKNKDFKVRSTASAGISLHESKSF
jgi:hypothetical protein